MHGFRRTVAATGLTIGLVLVAGACSSDDGDDEGTADESTTEVAEETTTTTAETVNTGTEIEISEFSFAPGNATIAAGETVTWTNIGSARHTVTAEPAADGTQLFASDPVLTEQSFVQSFSTPGTYAYFCSIHPDRMSGTVVVE